MTPKEIIVAQLEKYAPLFVAAFKKMVSDIVEDQVADKLNDQISGGQLTEEAISKIVGAVKDMIEPHANGLAITADDVFAMTGQEESLRSIEAIQPPTHIDRAKLSFNPGNQRSAKVAKENRLSLIREMSDSQKDAIRQALEQGLREGRNPVDVARDFRQAIGLTRRQAAAVDNYRRLLETGNREATERSLRDRRYDRTVTGARDRGEPLGDRQISKMVERYRQRMIDYRAKTIGRTETMRALSTSRQESWRQTAERLGYDPDALERTWVATADEKTRDTHDELDGEVVVGLDEPWVTSSGDELRFPHDPEAPADETINCRCTVTVLFR